MPESQQAQVTLRLVTPEDCKRVWRWRNDRETREASFNTSHISYEDHQSWLSQQMRDANTIFFIVLDPDACEIGYLRFSLQGPEAEISISLDQNERGKGYGSASIRNGSELVLSTTLARRIIAHVKSSNIGSIASFQRAGFLTEKVMVIRDISTHRMAYDRLPRGRSPGKPSTG